jgi:WD40 repeat protein
VWDSSTWQQVGHPWKGHTSHIIGIAIDPNGTLVASASYDNHVRLWRLSDRQNIGIFQHSSPAYSVTFSVDGRYILSGGHDAKISQWEVPKGVHPKASFRVHPKASFHHPSLITKLEHPLCRYLLSRQPAMHV